jgi:DNA-binding response OmpR family regulator
MRTLDIVYLDIGLFTPASLATHRMLRARPDTKHVPIVLLSTRLARGGPTGLKLGMHDFFISSDTVRPQAFWNEYSEVMLAWH